MPERSSKVSSASASGASDEVESRVRVYREEGMNKILDYFAIHKAQGQGFE